MFWKNTAGLNGGKHAGYRLYISYKKTAVNKKRLRVYAGVLFSGGPTWA